MLIGLLGIVPGIISAQSNFTAPSLACLNERIDIQHNLGEETWVEWDFCARDLTQIPSITDVETLPGFLGGFGYKVVYDNGNYFAFVPSYAGNIIFRLDFGNSLMNTPGIVNLGNPGGLLNRPQSIDVAKVDGSWFAFVGYDTPGYGVVKLNFGTNLTSAPVATMLGNFGFSSSVFYDLKIVEEGGNKILVLLDRVNSFLIRVRFDNLIDYLPQGGDIYVTNSIPEASSIFSFDIGYSSGQKVVVLSSYFNNRIVSLNFGESILQDFISSSSYTSPLLDQPIRIRLVNEAGRNYLLVANNSPTLGMTIIDYHDFLNPPTDVPISLPPLFSVHGVRVNGETVITGLGNDSRVKRLHFKNECGASPTYSVQTQPGFLTYSTAGTKYIALKIFVQGENYEYQEQIVNVSSDQAPDISFNSQNNCVNHAINFEAQNVSGDLVSYQWDFKDSNTSNQANPSHVFTSASEYLVQLEVLAANGCKNIYQNEVTVINQPLVDFAIPEVTPVCTNQPYAFTNLTIFDSRIPPIWEWRVNGTVVSSNQQLQYLFTNSSSQSIQLAALIPGCESILIKNIPVITEGPLVNFSSFGQCQDAPVTFTNETTGAVNGYNWDFGDGQNSIDEDPLNSYGSPGTFDVTLTAFGTSGCNNTKTESVTIYSKPLTNFSVALPPFSCSGTPTQFTDITPNPFDSNLAFWQWNFGDGSGSSTARNPQYTFQNAGDYSVSLTATTNFGCSAIVQKPVTISPSPVANFTNSPPCLGVPINFTNTSTGSLQSQQWQIQSSFYTVANPVHAFLTSGDKNVTLNVTATNGCIASVSRTLNVPIVLTPDFSVSRNCINQETEFTDITNDAADPVVAYAWNFAGLGNGTENPQVFSFANTGNFNVSLSVTTQTGCVHSAAKNVSIINSPQASFIATPSFGPPPLQVQFTNTSTNATSYLWEFNDPNNSSSTSVSPSFTFSELGSYAVDLTAFNAQGCSSLFSRLIEVVIPFTDVALTQLELIETGQASVKPAVTIQNKGNIAITNLPLTFEVDGTAFRTFVTTSIPPNSSYYHLSDFELPASSSLTYVCALAEIEDTSPDDNQLCASVDQPIVVLAPYPNPATAQSHIDVQWIVRENRAVEVFMINSIGQTVYSERVNSVSGLNTFRLPATGFQTGLYFLQVRSGDFSRTHRLMIQE